MPVSISGFTFIRNGVGLGFPFEASIRSLLPLVDEFVVAVGKGEDDTLARVKAINDPKIRIIETLWNERMADRGFVYAQQKMIAQYSCTGDWAFYLQPTISAESNGFFTCLNTYDRARFTFGHVQLGAHTPDAVLNFTGASHLMVSGVMPRSMAAA